MNIGTARTKTFMLIDSYSRSGILLDPNDTKQKDYTLKMPFQFDTAQKQIATIKKIVKTKLISHAMPVNKLASPIYQFDIVQNNGADQIYQVTGTANAYYFEVDDVATIKIEEQTDLNVWTTLVTVNNLLADAGSFKAYKGRITPSVATNDIRIRFIGDATTSIYNHRNRALWSEKFSADSRVPNYERYVPYTMPTDFYQLNKVILKGQVNNSQSYENTADFFWERRNVIMIGWYNVGSYSVEYFAMPADIDGTTADATEFEVDIDAQELIPFYTAAMLLVNENNVVGDRMLNEYKEKLANLDPKITAGANSIENVMFTGGGTHKLF